MINADHYKIGDEIGNLTLIQEIPAIYEGTRNFVATCKCGNLTHTTLFGEKIDKLKHKACRTCKDHKVYAEGEWKIFKLRYKQDTAHPIRTKAEEQATLIGDFFDHTNAIGFTPFPRTIFVHCKKEYAKQLANAEDSHDLWMPIVNRIVGDKTFVFFTHKLELDTWNYFRFEEYGIYRVRENT